MPWPSGPWRIFDALYTPCIHRTYTPHVYTQRVHGGHTDRKGSMYRKAFAPEYQGALTTLSVNSSLTDVLADGTRELRAAERAGEHGEAARSGVAVAEADRRLGQVGEAEQA